MFLSIFISQQLYYELGTPTDSVERVTLGQLGTETSTTSDPTFGKSNISALLKRGRTLSKRKPELRKATSELNISQTAMEEISPIEYMPNRKTYPDLSVPNIDGGEHFFDWEFLSPVSQESNTLEKRVQEEEDELDKLKQELLRQPINLDIKSSFATESGILPSQNSVLYDYPKLYKPVTPSWKSTKFVEYPFLKDIKSIQHTEGRASYGINISNSQFYVPKNYVFSKAEFAMNDLRFEVDPEMTNVLKKSKEVENLAETSPVGTTKSISEKPSLPESRPDDSPAEYLLADKNLKTNDNDGTAASHVLKSNTTGHPEEIMFEPMVNPVRRSKLPWTNPKDNYSSESLTNWNSNDTPVTKENENSVQDTDISHVSCAAEVGRQADNPRQEMLTTKHEDSKPVSGMIDSLIDDLTYRSIPRSFKRKMNGKKYSASAEEINRVGSNEKIYQNLTDFYSGPRSDENSALNMDNHEGSSTSQVEDLKEEKLNSEVKIAEHSNISGSERSESPIYDNIEVIKRTIVQSMSLENPNPDLILAPRIYVPNNDKASIKDPIPLPRKIIPDAPDGVTLREKSNANRQTRPRPFVNLPTVRKVKYSSQRPGSLSLRPVLESDENAGSSIKSNNSVGANLEKDKTLYQDVVLRSRQRRIQSQNDVIDKPIKVVVRESPSSSLERLGKSQSADSTIKSKVSNSNLLMRKSFSEDAASIPKIKDRSASLMNTKLYNLPHGVYGKIITRPKSVSEYQKKFEELTKHDPITVVKAKIFDSNYDLPSAVSKTNLKRLTNASNNMKPETTPLNDNAVGDSAKIDEGYSEGGENSEVSSKLLPTNPMHVTETRFSQSSYVSEIPLSISPRVNLSGSKFQRSSSLTIRDKYVTIDEEPEVTIRAKQNPPVVHIRPWTSTVTLNSKSQHKACNCGLCSGTITYSHTFLRTFTCLLEGDC